MDNVQSQGEDGSGKIGRYIYICIYIILYVWWYAKGVQGSGWQWKTWKSDCNTWGFHGECRYNGNIMALVIDCWSALTILRHCSPLWGKIKQTRRLLCIQFPQRYGFTLLHCNKNLELQILQQDDTDTASKKKTPVVCIAEAVLVAQPEKGIDWWKKNIHLHLMIPRIDPLAIARCLCASEPHT